MRIPNDFVAAICKELESRFNNGNTWMAYTTPHYFTKEKDMHFFSSRTEAEEFSINKKGEGHYLIIPIEPLIKIMDDWFMLTCTSEIYTENLHVNSFQVRANYEMDQLQKNNSLTINANVMNEENLKYLKSNIKYMGFGENLNDQLENNLNQGKEKFNLDFKAVINNKAFDATLHFSKSAKTDMYFFNSYDASLKRGNGEQVDKTFYLDNGKGITAKEAYNLLDGRAVHKELTNKDNVEYKAWQQLDFQEKDKHNEFKVKQFHENYGFDLKEAVGKYAITDLNDVKKSDDLMKSLQKGNIQSVTIEKDGNTHKMFIEANPQFKTVNLYDGQMKRIQKEDIGQYQATGQAAKAEVKQEKEEVKKNDVKQDVKKDNKEKKSLLPKKQNSNGLLPKNRVSNKKGLSV